MRVRIVCYEEKDAWILGKFARKLNEELLKLGISSDIAKTIDPKADINHHIIYLSYDKNNYSGNDTLMITHIDDILKLKHIKTQMSVARLGICMSKSVIDQLVLSGLPKEKLCYISPAHDQNIALRPFSVGITSRVYPDGCKREDMLLKLSEHISPALFEFKIMGAGWERIVKKLEERGFKITYYPQFVYDDYTKLIPSLDYYLYFGMDEGSMGFIDALAAGVKTIVTPQGYHLDAENGITHPFVTMEELISVFDMISKERKSLIDSVATWTWRDYAIKHLELWNYILFPQKQVNSVYKDGLNSLNANTTSVGKDQAGKNFSSSLQLYVNAIRKKYYRIRKT